MLKSDISLQCQDIEKSKTDLLNIVWCCANSKFSIFYSRCSKNVSLPVITFSLFLNYLARVKKVILDMNLLRICQNLKVIQKSLHFNLPK